MNVPIELARSLCDRIDRTFEPEQVPWLRRLVDQPSHTHAREDVETAAQIVEQTATALGLSCQRHPDPGGEFADHRVFSSAATAPDGRALALVGHVDTVFPRSLGFLEYRRDQGDDVIRGPGVLDMKSGLSAILFALEALEKTEPGALERLPVRFVCNGDEEVGSPTSAQLFADLAPLTTKALVFEAGRDGDRVITRRKGGAVYRLHAHGKSAHAGNDHGSGANAIHALALAIARVEDVTDYERGVTLNVGLVEGGTAKNTVPDRATCVIDGRFLKLEDGAWIREQLEAIAAEPLEGRLEGVRITLEGDITRPPMEATEDSQALRQAYEACAAAVGLRVGEAPLQGGGSDANLLSAAGVPCIDGLGPHGKNFHRVEEWSSLDSLRRKTQALACFLAGELTDA